MPSDLASLVEHAESLLKSKEYEGAVATADAVLSNSLLSRLAVVRGNALLFPLMDQIMNDSVDPPKRCAFNEALEMFNLALKLEPENATARTTIQNLEKVRETLLPDEPYVSAMSVDPYDVIIVGAGPSGIGVALMLTRVFGLGADRVLLLERGGAVGETFLRWPKEMRFISPSFNQQGWTKSFDLNSVAFGTSPAFTLHAEHPSGEQYAAYLGALAQAGGLCIRLHTEVLAVRTRNDEEGFDIDTAPVGGEEGGIELLQSRFVVWAAGEFQYPNDAASSPPFPGFELCQHNSSVRSWRELPGDDFVVIGGYESGMDAAFNLSTCGKRCSVVSSTAYWNVVTADPSTELSPYTAERVRAACASATPPKLLAPLRVVAVEAADEERGGYLVRARWGPRVEHQGAKFRLTHPVASASDCAEGSELTLRTPQPPLVCTGFAGSVKASAAVNALFDWRKQEGHEAQAEEGHEGHEAHAEEGHEGRGGPTDTGHGHEDECVHGHEGKGEGHGHEGHECHGHGGHGSNGHGDSGAGAKGGCLAGAPLLTEQDESTKTPGLFLVGPSVRHGQHVLCFIYKFRQRFGIVANAIAQGLGLHSEQAVEQSRNMNMFLDNFDCCKGACGETC